MRFLLLKDGAQWKVGNVHNVSQINDKPISNGTALRMYKQRGTLPQFKEVTINNKSRQNNLNQVNDFLRTLNNVN